MIDSSVRDPAADWNSLERDLHLADFPPSPFPQGVIYDARVEDPKQKDAELNDIIFVDLVFTELQDKGADSDGFIDEELRSWGRQMVLLIQRRHRLLGIEPYAPWEIRILVTEMFYADQLHRRFRKKQRDDGTLYSREHLFKSVRNAVVVQKITDLPYLLALLRHDDGEDLSIHQEETPIGERKRRLKPELLLADDYYRTELVSEFGPQTVDIYITVLRRKLDLIVRGLTKEKDLRRSAFSNEEVNFQRLLSYTDQEVLVVLARLAERLHNVRTLDGKAKKRPERAREIAYATMDVHARLAKTFEMDELFEELVDACFTHVNPALTERFLEEQQRRIAESFVESGLKSTVLDEIVRMGTESDGMGLQFIGIQPKSMGACVDPSYIREEAYDPFSKDCSKGGIDPLDPLYEILILIDDPKKMSEMIRTVTFAFRKASMGRAIEMEVKQGSSTVLPCSGTSIRIFDPALGYHLKIRINDERNEALKARGVFAEVEEGVRRPIMHLPYAAPDTYRESIREILDQTRDCTDGIFDLAESKLLRPTIDVKTPRLDSVRLPRGSRAMDFPGRVHHGLLADCSSICLRRGGAFAQPAEVHPFTPLMEGDLVDVKKGGKPLWDPSWFALGNTGTRAALKAIARGQSVDQNTTRGRKYIDGLSQMLGLASSEVLVSFLLKSEASSRSVLAAQTLLHRIGALYVDPLEMVANSSSFAQRPLSVSVEVPDETDSLGQLTHEFGLDGVSIVGAGVSFGERYQAIDSRKLLALVSAEIQSVDLKRVTPHDVLLCLLRVASLYPLKVNTEILNSSALLR